MPRPSPRSFGDLPLQTGSNSTLGIKVKSRGNAFYFLAARGALRRYGRRFPLTEEGWVDAWTAFVSEDPAGARLYRDSLKPGPRRSTLPPGAAAGNGADLNIDGWGLVLVGGVGWMSAAALAYEGMLHVSAMLVLIGGALAFCSMVATFFGVVVEGIRLARRTSQ